MYVVTLYILFGPSLPLELELEKLMHKVCITTHIYSLKSGVCMCVLLCKRLNSVRSTYNTYVQLRPFPGPPFHVTMVWASFKLFIFTFIFLFYLHTKDFVFFKKIKKNKKGRSFPPVKSTFDTT